MFGLIKHLRLLIILIAFAVLLIIQGISHVTIWALRFALDEEWKLGVGNVEYMMYRRVLEYLNEPTDRINDLIKPFTGDTLDVKGFKNWLDKNASDNPLIGTVIIWQRGNDSVWVKNYSATIDDDLRRKYIFYLNTVNDTGYYNPRNLNIFRNIDSLKTQLRRASAYTLYEPRRTSRTTFDDTLTLGKKKAFVNAVFVIIWNKDYYRNVLFPQITSKITDNHWALNLYPDDYISDYPDLINGLLIRDADGDTLFSYGRVTADPDSIGPLYPYYRMPLRWGWNITVQNRIRRLGLDIPEHLSLGFVDELTDGWREGLQDFERLSSQMHEISPKIMKFVVIQWILLGLGMLVLFGVILTQIIARNRQRDFIAQVSHELRTPLARIQLHAETLRYERTISPEQETDYLNTILQASGHLTVLIDNALNLARLDAGKMKVQPVSGNIGQFIEEFFNRHNSIWIADGFQTELKIESNLPQVKFDRSMLEVAMRNLTDNAVKYSEAVKEIEISVAKGLKSIIITVADRGLGVPSGKQKVIFRRYNRFAHPGVEPRPGAGVGLAIVREIVHAHRGKVWCEARDGGGSCFIVELPG